MAFSFPFRMASCNIRFKTMITQIKIMRLPQTGQLIFVFSLRTSSPWCLIPLQLTPCFTWRQISAPIISSHLTSNTCPSPSRISANITVNGFDLPVVLQAQCRLWDFAALAERQYTTRVPRSLLGI